MRPVDVYFKQYNSVFKGSTQIILLCILVVLFYFGLIGLVWAVPFPHINFLHSYNGYFNWASFLIAGLMFYWYKQSPLLSYFLLMLLFSTSYSVTLIEAAHPAGPMSTRVIYSALLVVTVFGLVKITAKRNLKFFSALLFIPLWLIRVATRRLNINY